MKTKCIIVDDEPLAIKLLKSHVEQVETLELVAECRNAMQAYDVLRKKQVDLMLMDIQMPQITGLDFLKSLSNPPKVIITTAYRNYAPEGFELEVVDYLLKPIQFDRFFKAINRFYQVADHDIKVIDSLNNQHGEKSQFIYVKENKKVNKIFLDSIVSIEGLGEYVKICTNEGNYVTKNSLNNLESKLPHQLFVRTHKSFIIALSKVTAFTSTTIEIGKTEFPIGRTYKNEVLKALNFDSDLI